MPGVADRVYVLQRLLREWLRVANSEDRSQKTNADPRGERAAVDILKKIIIVALGNTFCYTDPQWRMQHPLNSMKI